MISFATKLNTKIDSVREAEACGRRHEAPNRETKKQDSSGEPRFVVTFYNGRRPNIFDESAVDARVERELSEARERQEALSRRKSESNLFLRPRHPKPFRVAGVPIVKGFELRMLAAKDWATYCRHVDPPSRDNPKVISRAYEPTVEVTKKP